METRVNRTPLLIASIYIPPEHIYQLDKLDAVLQNIDRSVNLLLLSDFNARSHVWKYWHQLGTHLSGKAWRMGSKVVELCHSHGLSIHNNGQYTRIQNGTISAPDLTLSRGLRITAADKLIIISI